MSVSSKLLAQLRNLLTNEDGQALAEYGLILGLVAVVCIIALTGIGLAVSGSLDSIAAALGDVGGGGGPTVGVGPPVVTS